MAIRKGDLETDIAELISGDEDYPQRLVGGKLTEALKSLASTQGTGHPDEVRERERNKPLNERTIKDMTDAVDKLEVDDNGMINAFTIEAESTARRLRHRANLMRLRAQEFEDEAERLTSVRLKEVTEAITSLASGLRTANDVLRNHAHIEPQRVENGNGDGTR